MYIMQKVHPCSIQSCVFYIQIDDTKYDMDASKGDRASGPPPLNISQNIRFLRNTGPDPLKITKQPG